MFSEQVLVSARHFNGSALQPAQPDKNGLNPIVLSVVAGKAPNRTVLSGTYAKNAGFEPGKAYLASVTEVEPDAQYGRQFRWQVVMEVTNPLHIVEITKSIGSAQIIQVAETIAAQAQTASLSD